MKGLYASAPRPLKLCLLICALGASASTYAQNVNNTHNKLQLGLNAWAEVSNNDNATRVPESLSALKLQEQKNSYGADVFGAFASNLVDFNATYSGVQEVYTKDSQEEEFVYRGQSNLAYGNDDSVFDVSIGHKTNRVLNSPEDEDINENTNQQSTLFGSAGIKTRGDKADSVQLSATYGSVDFKDQEQRVDAEQIGAELRWDHRTRFSKHFGVVLASSEIRHDEQEDLDFDYTLAYAFLESNARLVDYSIQIGTNIAKPIDESEDEESSPFYSFELNFDSYGNIINVSTLFQLSSTSFVEGIAANEGQSFVSGDAEVNDQVEVSTTSVNWINNAICLNCTLTVNYQLQTIDYLTFEESDQDTSSYSVGFGYQLTRNVGLLGRYTIRDTEYVNDGTRGTKRESIDLRGTYEFGPRNYMEIFASQQHRDRQAESFDFLEYGLRLGIRLP